MRQIVFFSIALLFSLNTQAKLFSNSYVSFELPPNWSCKVAGTEWVCRSSDKDQARQAIIVLTAKEQGPNDNFAYYNQYLKTPKTPKNRDGSISTRSKVMHLKTVQITNHAWVDGLHLGSLLPKFYSRYLVTIKDGIAILVTFSAKKEFYTQYSQHFFNTIKSLKVTTQAKQRQANIKGADEALGVDLGAAMDDDSWGTKKKKKKSSNMWLYGLALSMASVGGYLLYKRQNG